MSAANWRGAMNVRARRRATSGPTGTAPAGASRGGAPARAGRRPRAWRFTSPVRLRHVVVLAFLLAYPWFAPPFFTFQIGAQALALGLIALSLTFLGRRRAA